MRVVSATARGTTLDDFAGALACVRHELAYHERDKPDEWRARSVRYHARHGFVHFMMALWWMSVGVRGLTKMHLAHALCRALFALERLGERGACRDGWSARPTSPPTPRAA